MKKILVLTILMALILFASDKVYACGSCVDFSIDWYLPFLKFWAILFFIWLFIGMIFRIIGKSHNISIPLKLSRRLWLFLIGCVGIWLLGLGSILLPLLIVIIPSWFIWMYRAQKNTKLISNRVIMQNAFIIFQRVILLAIIASFLIYMATFNSTKRLLAKIDYPGHFTNPAQKILVKKGRVVLPEILSLLEKFNENSYSSRVRFINLMGVVRQIGDTRATPSVARILKNIEYIDETWMDKVYAEAAQTLTVLDKDLAANTIVHKLEEINNDKNISEYHLVKIFDVFIECLIKTGNQNAISAVVVDIIPERLEDIKKEIRNKKERTGHLRTLFGILIKHVVESNNKVAIAKVITDDNMDIIIESTKYTNAGDSSRVVLETLGSPFFDQNSEAYRKWWKDKGRTKYRVGIYN